MNLFTNLSFSTLEKALDGAALRQRTISHNIANVDTPNYKTKKVNFQHTLDQAVSQNSFNAIRTDNRHMNFSTGKQREAYVTSVNNTMYNHNLNNVDIDKEMSALAENQIYYNALIDRLNGRFNSLQTVIKGGK
ncbi:flagellar basal body rod protein FlgB [Alkalihalobacterium alkalinitrilicum]|uniref:flagellar basal body rod protein FlgB n=1 Tax=Alkalihalobacterium alkalinitrilicum TaxID=427920 RepID=UPI0009949169|nr:flagellar basal body rod protein FlgB [Alkalihalobacterium alkalinitrilicum]